MRKFGFKLFSSNLQTAPDLIDECADFAATHDDIFVELMVIPNTQKDDLLKIKSKLSNCEVRIHAPHSTMGFDAGNKDLRKQNQKMFALSQWAADIFQSQTIVVHAGCGHNKENIEETTKQFLLFHDPRIVIENLPRFDSDGELLHGNTLEEIKFIMNETKCGFCFDFSHAICAALSFNIDIEKQLKGFFELNPSVYHMCDGDINKAEDAHLHFGAGNYNLKHFLNDYTNGNAYITMETGEGVLHHNHLWIQDYHYLKSLQKA